MTKSGATSRERILSAAAELAMEHGPGNLSLDAVAARAGLSKGGLLYNFPTKAKLLEALVSEHLTQFDRQLGEEERRRKGDANALAAGFLALFCADELARKKPATGLLAAMAENPEFLDPVRVYNRSLVDRLSEGSGDFGAALVAFLAIEGMRTTQLLGLDVLTDAEREAAVTRLRELLGA